ncbi:MAG: DUF1064 domain-containing protein [Fastidiosipilaceae bacterium]|jgi:hypothetical protein
MQNYRMSAAEYQTYINKQNKPSKYRNKKVEVDGHTFDSLLEAKRYEQLKILKDAGEIKGFGLQPSFQLPGKIRYKADFIVSSTHGIWVEDVKGIETQVFKNKKKLFEATYPWLPLKILTKSEI